MSHAGMNGSVRTIGGSIDTAWVLDADERAELERERRESTELHLGRVVFEATAVFVVSELNR